MSDSYNSELVTTNDRLEELCTQWRNCDAVMVDTEFMRTDTFYPIPALFQIGTEDGAYLLDPLAIDDLTPLKALFSDTSVVKVLHSCSEDLEVFACALGVLPEPLFDTQVAAAIAGDGFSVGYANLVRKLLDVDLSKGETRSDWLQRPLSQSQQHYAAQDVIYLHKLYDILLDKLQAQGRLHWLQTDCATIVSAANAPVVLDELYTKVKGAWPLTSQELGILQKLTMWREEEARSRDVPRNRLIKDKGLLEIARNKPRHIKLLATLEGVPPRTVRGDGETIIDIVVAICEADNAQWPPRMPKPLPPEAGNLTRRLRDKVIEIADEMAISPEMLARKKDYEVIVRSGFFTGDYELPEYLSDWRREILEAPLLEEVATFERQQKRI
ncbi:MAG: ribonuclease D [Cellvibrionaceae bacterium]